ncbi:MAG: hypothetical protein JRF43_02080 [Deltaproteobacteria bacterium]|nr:hypothetical protein [Deltaproteobacteria bacterium]
MVASPVASARSLRLLARLEAWPEISRPKLLRLALNQDRNLLQKTKLLCLIEFFEFFQHKTKANSNASIKTNGSLSFAMLERALY